MFVWEGKWVWEGVGGWVCMHAVCDRKFEHANAQVLREDRALLTEDRALLRDLGFSGESVLPLWKNIGFFGENIGLF